MSVPSSAFLNESYFAPVSKYCVPGLSAYMATIQEVLTEACRLLGFHSTQLRRQTATLGTVFVLLVMNTFKCV